MSSATQQKNALAGRVFRWTFADGPTAGKTYEHTFSTDGTVAFKEVGGAAPSGGGGAMPGVKYASFEIAPNVHLVDRKSTRLNSSHRL